MEVGVTLSAAVLLVAIWLCSVQLCAFLSSSWRCCSGSTQLNGVSGKKSSSGFFFRRSKRQHRRATLGECGNNSQADLLKIGGEKNGPASSPSQRKAAAEATWEMKATHTVKTGGARKGKSKKDELPEMNMDGDVSSHRCSLTYSVHNDDTALKKGHARNKNAASIAATGSAQGEGQEAVGEGMALLHEALDGRSHATGKNVIGGARTCIRNQIKLSERASLFSKSRIEHWLQESTEIEARYKSNHLAA